MIRSRYLPRAFCKAGPEGPAFIFPRLRRCLGKPLRSAVRANRPRYSPKNTSRGKAVDGNYCRQFASVYGKRRNRGRRGVLKGAATATKRHFKSIEKRKKPPHGNPLPAKLRAAPRAFTAVFFCAQFDLMQIAAIQDPSFGQYALSIRTQLHAHIKPNLLFD